MKRISFACLFLCLTTSFLLPQTNPVPLRHGRAGRHSGLGVRPDSTFTTQVGGSIDCISDENVLINVSAGDMWAYATPPYEEIGTYPNAPVVEVSCGSNFSPSHDGIEDQEAQVNEQLTRFVLGDGWIDATCVVATGACSANVSGDVRIAYSSLPNGEEGPLLVNLSYSGTSSDCSINTFPTEDGSLYVYSLSCNFTGVTGQETLVDPVPQIYVPIVPTVVPPRSPGFTLTLNGFGFAPQATVNWNGSPRPTTFVSPSQLTALISAADVSALATALVTVSSPGSQSTSNAAYFSVTNATSSISLGRSDLSAALQPEAVVTGDFNQDGIPDLAVASFSGAVSVMIGNGDGTFRGQVDYVTGAGARGIVTGDFNGDGKLDLAVANQTSNTVSILLGNGDGTFQGHVDYPAGSGPFSLAIGDFNWDGALDLAVVNQNDNQVSILLGVGDGTFEYSASYNTGQLPFGIVTGDFNLDGNLDLAVANYTDGTISILLGNGERDVPDATDYATGLLPEMLATADLNADGKLDLAVGTNQVSGAQISILLGNGDGTFQPHNDFPAGSKPRSVIPVDLNGDGKVDLAIANYGSSSVSLLLGKGGTAHFRRR